MDMRRETVSLVFDPSRTWIDAIDAVAKCRPRDMLGSWYPPRPGMVKEHNVVLFNFLGPVVNGDYVTCWARSQSLYPCDPRLVFAIPERISDIAKRLSYNGRDDTYRARIVSLLPSMQNGKVIAPFIQREEDGWEIGSLQYNLGFDSCEWFAFGEHHPVHW